MPAPFVPPKYLLLFIGVAVAVLAVLIMEEGYVIYLVTNTASFGVTITSTILLTAIATVAVWGSLYGFGELSVKMGWREAEETRELYGLGTLNRRRTTLRLAAGEHARNLKFAVERESDSTQWINEIAGSVWPMITAYVRDNLKESIEKSIQAAVPLGGRTIYFREIGVGTIPMKFLNMRTRVLKKQSSGGTKRMMQLLMDVDYSGDLKIVLSAFGCKVGVSNFLLKGTMVIEFPEVLPVPPFLSGMNFYFPIKPEMSMNWEGVAAIAKDPHFAHRVQGVLEAQVSSRMVLPNRIGTVMAARNQLEKFRVLKPRPAGVLRVAVKSAKNLKAADVSLMSMGKPVSSDPFVIVELGDLSFQTKTIKINLNPVWENEAHQFLVHFPSVQKVLFKVFDEDRFSAADKLGTCEARVVDLVTRDQSTPLTLDDGEGDGENSCKRLGSKLFVEATYKPLKLSEALSKEIKSGSLEPTCMVFVGVSSAFGLPAADYDCSHWCEVIVKDVGKPGYEWSTCHVMVQHSETLDEVHRKKKLKRNIKLLEDANVDKHIIKEVLELQEEDNLNRIGDMTAVWDDGLFHLLHDPHAATIEFQMKTDAMPDGKMKKGSAQTIGKPVVVQVSELMAAKDNTHSDRLLPFGIEDDSQMLNIMLQLRVLGAPTKEVQNISAVIHTEANGG